uniref:Uncharacterized protein n=1 Tax=Aegilops tauschii subsp. strangulata TaxID=200361 RepID=A0A453L7N1_AEGTS
RTFPVRYVPPAPFDLLFLFASSYSPDSKNQRSASSSSARASPISVCAVRLAGAAASTPSHPRLPHCHLATPRRAAVENDAPPSVVTMVATLAPPVPTAVTRVASPASPWLTTCTVVSRKKISAARARPFTAKQLSRKELPMVDCSKKIR